MTLRSQGRRDGEKDGTEEGAPWQPLAAVPAMGMGAEEKEAGVDPAEELKEAKAKAERGLFERGSEEKGAGVDLARKLEEAEARLRRLEGEVDEAKVERGLLERGSEEFKKADARVDALLAERQQAGSLVATLVTSLAAVELEREKQVTEREKQVTASKEAEKLSKEAELVRERRASEQAERDREERERAGRGREGVLTPGASERDARVDGASEEAPSLTSSGNNAASASGGSRKSAHGAPAIYYDWILSSDPLSPKLDDAGRESLVAQFPGLLGIVEDGLASLSRDSEHRPEDSCPKGDDLLKGDVKPHIVSEAAGTFFGAVLAAAELQNNYNSRDVGGQYTVLSADVIVPGKGILDKRNAKLDGVVRMGALVASVIEDKSWSQTLLGHKGQFAANLLAAAQHNAARGVHHPLFELAHNGREMMLLVLDPTRFPPVLQATPPLNICDQGDERMTKMIRGERLTFHEFRARAEAVDAVLWFVARTLNAIGDLRDRPPLSDPSPSSSGTQDGGGGGGGGGGGRGRGRGRKDTAGSASGSGAGGSGAGGSGGQGPSGLPAAQRGARPLETSNKNQENQKCGNSGASTLPGEEPNGAKVWRVGNLIVTKEAYMPRLTLAERGWSGIPP
jgi:hypothetical protein